MTSRAAMGDKIDSDDGPVYEQRPLRPKEPLTPLTEWRTPSAEPSTLPGVLEAPQRLSRRPLVIIGVALALIAAYFVLDWLLAEPKVGDLVERVPLAEDIAPVKKPEAPIPTNASITLSSGVTIERRSSPLNYDLASWLATTPTEPRTFTFERLRFDPGSAALYESDKPMLQLLSQVLTVYSKAKVVIVANGPGSLAQQRADAIRAALLQLAADPDQVTAAAGDSSESPPKLTVKLEMGVGTDLDA